MYFTDIVAIVSAVVSGQVEKADTVGRGCGHGHGHEPKLIFQPFGGGVCYSFAKVACLAY